MEYTVGELAKHSGLTVRALHHYEQLGLLRPSGRTEAGYRLYADEDVVVLHRIVAYQEMGLPLKEIGALLGDGAPPLHELLARQIAAAEDQLARQQRLLAMLRRVEKRAREGGPGMTDYLLQLVSEMRTYQKWFSGEELQRLHDAQASVGEENLPAFKARFDELMAGFRDALARGLPPTDETVAALARRMIEAGAQFEDDAAIKEKGRAMLAASPAMQQRTGLTPALLDYVDAAVAVAKGRAS